MERLGIEFHQNDPRNADNYMYVGVVSRCTPVWLHKEVAACDVKFTIGQAQSNHSGAGGGGKLILPASSRRDDRVEPLRVRPVAADALRRLHAGPMRSNIHEGLTLCGLSRDDERRPRHARPRDRVHLRLAPRCASQGDRALQRDLCLRAPGPHPRRTSRSAACSRRPTTWSFHTGWGCMSADFVVKDGGSIIYCSPVTRRVDGDRRLPGIRSHGSPDGVHRRRPRTTSRCSRTSTRVRSRCGPAASVSRSTR